MKIAITINSSWNIYNFRLGLIKALIGHGHEIVAIAPKDEFSGKLESEGCTYVSVEIDNTGSNPFNDYTLLKNLKKIYAQQKPDVVLHYTVKPNIYGTLAAHSLGIPVINNVSGLGTVFLSNGLTSFVAKKLYKKAFEKAQLVFFQNPDDQKTFLSEIDLPNLNTALLPGSGINLSDFNPEPIPTRKEKVFLMISRIIIEKGVLDYIEAARLVQEVYPNAKFQILGKIDQNHARGISEQIVSQAMKDGYIEYLGETDNVKPYLTAAHCVVLPSYREGTPRTLLEAGATGRPIVTTDVPGCREVIRDSESGYLCQVKNALDLSQKMLSICEKTNEELQIMGLKSRKLIEDKFDEQIVINHYIKHLSNIMNELPTE